MLALKDRGILCTTRVRKGQWACPKVNRSITALGKFEWIIIDENGHEVIIDYGKEMEKKYLTI